MSARVGRLEPEGRRELLRRSWERLDPRFRTRHQLLGRRSTVGCVALEVTQRCNLRCTSCYLSEGAERVADVPLDVVFHVDTTQQRAGARSEADLHAVRDEYVERSRGLGIAAIFNTTVHDGNLHEVPDLARFFLERSGVVGMASFQVHAATGRGTMGRREAVTMEGIRGRIEDGIGARGLAWDGALIGHPGCHQAAMLVTAGDRVFDVLADRPLFARFLDDFRHLSFDRRDVRGTAKEVIRIAFGDPYYAVRGGAFLLKGLWALKGGLLRTRGKTGKLTFFIENFQDADALDPERVASCAFMVMTADGPVSMCALNARRDELLAGSAAGTALPLDPVLHVPFPAGSAGGLPVHPLAGGR